MTCILFDHAAQLSKALGVGRGDTTQAWQLPSIAVDGPFGTASEVSCTYILGLTLCHITVYAHESLDYRVYFMLCNFNR